MAANQRKPDIVHESIEGAWSRHLPKYSGMCPICRKTSQRTARILAFLEKFHEFGYTTLTREEMEKAYDLAMAGPVSNSGDIIAMLTRRQLEEANLVATSEN